MTAYYNEFEPYAAEWLRNLIREKLIAPGIVDDRSICEVQPSDLQGFDQVHFFAGLGGWSRALRLASWPDDEAVWTGSCPCQPFSVAGKGAGQADARHLWPEMFRLIRECSAPVVFGEQVAAAVGKSWLDGVSADLERVGYAVGSAVIPACAVDAPHRRDRLWFVADCALEHTGSGRYRDAQQAVCSGWDATILDGGSSDGVVAYTDQSGAGTKRQQRGGQFSGVGCHSEARDCCDVADTDDIAGRQRDSISRGCAGGSCTGQIPGSGGAYHGDVANPDSTGSSFLSSQPGDAREERQTIERDYGRGAWSNYEWLQGHDGKARRVEPGIRLLAHGVPARVGRLRAYGNAIVPEVAAQFIGAYLDTRRAS